MRSGWRHCYESWSLTKTGLSGRYAMSQQISQCLSMLQNATTGTPAAAGTTARARCAFDCRLNRQSSLSLALVGMFPRLATAHSAAPPQALSIEYAPGPQVEVPPGMQFAPALPYALIPVPPSPRELPVDLGLRSAAALVLDQEAGYVLYAKNSDVVMPIASITKLMTAMIILETRLPLDALVTITDEDVDRLKNSGSRLHRGVTLPRREMLRLALAASENRAAAALGRTYPGGTARFVSEMNRKAAELGMRKTRYVDPTGLSPFNVSTASDLARLVNASHHYPLIREYSTAASIQIALSLGRRTKTVTFRNTNGLVRSGQWEIGLQKTGYIKEAGRCLVMQARIGAKPVIIVLLDSWGKLSRLADASRIKHSIESGTRLAPSLQSAAAAGATILELNAGFPSKHCPGELCSPAR